MAQKVVHELREALVCVVREVPVSGDLSWRDPQALLGAGIMPEVARLL